jgi:predicted O-methyltransferase YrrM
MADSWRQALTILRREGPVYFARFATARLTGLAKLRRELRSLPPGGDLGRAIDLVVDRPLGASQAVYSMQRKPEIAELLRRAADLRPRVVVEIGTASGGTLFLLTRVAAPDALLVSLDLPGGRFGGGYQAWRKPIYRSFAAPGQRIVLLRGSSHDPAMAERLRRQLGGRAIDFLFIDGDHSYDGVRADFETYAPLVRPGGLIAFHDIVPDPKQPDMQVERFWREVSARYPSAALVENPSQQHGYGIGLLTWPGADERG